MTKKKRGHPSIEDVLERPWCYYCERDFEDLKVLISHQKAKHYKCDRCGRRLNTAGGLQVHLQQVHKENLTEVDNALPNRNKIDVEIFGMEGIPDDVMQQHNQRVTQEFYANEAAHRAATGNPPSGNAQQGPAGAKKPKLESPSDIKKRLAEHKAKKLAEQQGLGSASPVTPIPSAASPANAQFQQPFGATPANPPQPGFPGQPYGQQPGHPQFPGQQSGQPPFPGHARSPFEFQDAQFGAQPPHTQGPYPPAGQFGPPQPQYSPPPQQYGMPQRPPFPQGQFNGAPGHFNGPPAQFNGFNASGPPSVGPFPHQPPFHTPPASSPGPTGPPGPPGAFGAPQRQSSLPSVPGLPQRPQFDAPPISRSQLQEMHHGQSGPAQHSAPEASAISSSVDDLISKAQQGAQTPAQATPPKAQTPEVTKPTELNGTPKPAEDTKKGKKSTRLVYSDQQMSPEEKMASMSRYSFTPRRSESRALGPVDASVTGIVRGPDDVIDRQGD